MNLNRRSFVVGATSAMIAPALAQTAADLSAFAYIAADGTGDGTSWDDAADIRRLPELMERVGSGGYVLLLAEGTYSVTEPITLGPGGSPGGYVTVSGANRSNAARPARLVGNRRGWNGASGPGGAVNAADFGGDPLFILAPGAANIRLVNLDVRDVGRVLDMGGKRARNLLIEDIRFTNIRDGIYTDGDSAVTDVVIRGFSGRGYSKKAIRFHGRCANWLIENCELDSGWQYGDNFAVGIEASDRAHGLRVVGGYTTNSWDRQSDDDEYWNGDGIASERGNYDIVIQNHRSSGHSDGGYDFKSEATRLINCVSEGNKRNFRIWGGTAGEPVLLDGCRSLAPRHPGGTGGAYHLWLSGSGDDSNRAASVVWRNGVLSGGPDVAIYAEGGNVAVHLVDTDISGLPRSGELFETDVESSRVLIGSASGEGIRSILTESPITVVAGAAVAVPLRADGDASWRIVGQDGDFTLGLNGAEIDINSAEGTSGGSFLVQARDLRAEVMTKSIDVSVVENPVGAGAVFSLMLDPARPTAPASDKTGLNQVAIGGTPELVDGGLRFSGSEQYFEIVNSPNLHLDGPFTIQTRFSLDAVGDSGQDVITYWRPSSNQRSFVLGVEEDARLFFVWSTTGRTRQGNEIFGPAIQAGRPYAVTVTREEDGIIRLYVDGALAGQSAEAVEGLYPSRAALRVSGRGDGDAAGTGTLYQLAIYKGRAVAPDVAAN